MNLGWSEMSKKGLRAGQGFTKYKTRYYCNIILTLQECAEKVKNHLPEQDFKAMIYMLRKFLGFMNLTVSIALN